MKNKRIVFMGTPSFAANVLEGLLQAGYNIVGVVTQVDAPVGRKRILTPSPVKEVSLKHNLKLLQPLKIRNEYQEVLDLEPELIITCAYGQIIPKILLDCPKYHCINTHASLLPKWRGGAPIQHSIINGDEFSGVSIMYMNEKMDEGDILYQEKLAIDINDTSTTLFARLSDLALDMLLKYLPLHFSGDINPIKQDHSLATYAPNLNKNDEFINFYDDVLKVYNHIRGLLDNPGAYSIIKDKKVKFSDVSFTNEVLGPAGMFYGLYQDKIAVCCENGAILFGQLQMEGKKSLPAKDFYNGSGKGLMNEYYAKQN